MHLYPHHPGHQDGNTSREAAEKIAPRADFLKAKVLAALHVRPMTPDEIAASLGESILAIRPRCTELKALGLVVATPETRRNASGCRARVLAVQPEAAQ